MSTPLPNCLVAVQFNETHKTFSFQLEGSSRGWQVFPDGSIYPAMLGRRVQFRIKDDPGTVIGGFEISNVQLDPEHPPTIRWNKLPIGTDGVGSVCPISPNPYPNEDSDETLTELTLDLGVNRWFYRLAVVTSDGQLTWDDPKIHDDGSQ
jgi:hypothetical protein